MKVEKECLNCKKLFPKRRNDSMRRWETRICCSFQCYNEALRSGKRVHQFLGKKHTKEAREKMSKALTGIKLSKEHKRKVSEALKGHPTSEETKKKISLANTSKKRTEEQRKRIGEAHIGQKAWNKGKSCPWAKPPHFWDEEHPKWKGNEASIQAMHFWVKRRKGTPSKCEHCGRTDKKKYEWANVDHSYRRDLGDYMRLCTSCHRKYDIQNNGYVSGLNKLAFAK